MIYFLIKVELNFTKALKIFYHLLPEEPIPIYQDMLLASRQQITMPVILF